MPSAQGADETSVTDILDTTGGMGGGGGRGGSKTFACRPFHGGSPIFALFSLQSSLVLSYPRPLSPFGQRRTKQVNQMLKPTMQAFFLQRETKSSRL